MAHNEDRSNRSRRVKAAVAGVVGAFLLLGGTFALWSDSDQISGATITNGDLDVKALENGFQLWDITSQRHDAVTEAPVTRAKGHGIADINDWNLVPGDTVQATYLYDVTLKGDNLVADLSTRVYSSNLPDSVTLWAQAYLWDTEQQRWSKAGDLEPVGGSAVTIARVQAAEQQSGDADTDEAGNSLPILAEPGKDGNVAVVIMATMSSQATGREDANATIDFSSVTLEAKQVRLVSA